MILRTLFSLHICTKYTLNFSLYIWYISMYIQVESNFAHNIDNIIIVEFTLKLPNKMQTLKTKDSQKGFFGNKYN